MTTLYDMLDIRPDDDAGTVKDAFRKAAKVSHPDLNADDPDASTRFQEVVRANAILSDPELRAVYDRMLEFERRQHQPASVAYNVVPDAIVVVVLAVVMAGAYTLYTNLPEISVYLPKIPIAKIKVASDTARKPSAAIVQPSPLAEANASDSSRDKLESAKIPGSGAVALTESSAVAAPDAARAPGNVAVAPSSPPADANTGDSPRDKRESTEAAAPSALAPADVKAGVENAPYEPANAAAGQSSPAADTNASSNPRDRPENTESPTQSDVAPTENGVVTVEDLTHKPASAAAIEPSPPADADTSGSTRDRGEGAETPVPNAAAPAANGGDATEKAAPAPGAVTPPTTGPATEKNLPQGASGSAPLKDAHFYREQGIESYRNGNLTVAVADFDRAIRLDPNLEEAYIDRGIALYRLRKFDRAFADVAQAMRIVNSHRTPSPKAHPN